MNRTETIVLIVLLSGLVVAGTGLLYLGAAPESSPSSSTPTLTITPSGPEPTLTPVLNPRTQTDEMVSVGDSSYNPSDGSLRVTFVVTGGDWAVNIHRAEIAVTTLTPEEYTDVEGKTHATTSYWNETTELPESKSYAFVASQIAEGAETPSQADDTYLITVLLPTVVDETIRFTVIEGDSVTSFYERDF